MTNPPFIFDTELRLVVLTGTTVRSLRALRAELPTVPDSSIFFHTHQAYLADDVQRSAPYSDFARWVSETLREEALAEKLVAIELPACTTIQELRHAVIATVDAYLNELNRPDYQCRSEEAFHFCRSRGFVMPTGMVANDVDDFFRKAASISHASLYFHFFEARLQLGRRATDFARWLNDRGEPNLSAAVDALNPYIRTLDELRRDLVDVGART